ncbi:amidohydrolase family protein [Cupriavidus pauculus]|uniref:Hydrolase n=1 Tax=Cupriavidus pauculus TaxID=82633 RepID=A0A2N5CBF7_9BURK|nr:amidohydrolase family protein [Cupriavidus pauculus]PLP99514.1 hydrolase [Cupriavidus pauculus]
MTTRQPLVDCHFHVFDAGVAVASARYRPSYAAPLTAWLAMAGTVGGAPGDAYGVVVQTSFLGTDNSMMLATLQRMPGRLRGVAVLDPSVSDAELAALDAAGVRGIRLNLYGDDGWRRIETAPWRRLFQRVAALGWHVEVHTNNGEGASVLSALDAALGDTPAPVVLDHFGRPGELCVDDPIFDAARTVGERRPLWVKISAPYRLSNPDLWSTLTTRWAEVAGPDRLLWGSDWPWTNFEGPTRADECRTTMVWLAQRPHLEEGLRWRNAAALYGFVMAD